MDRLSNLPVEILDQIIFEISSKDCKSLSSLAKTCRVLYLYVQPWLFRRVRLCIAGKYSLPKIIAILTYLTPPKGERSKKRKGKQMEGGNPEGPQECHGCTSKAAAGTQPSFVNRDFVLQFVKEVVVDGYWSYRNEEKSEEYNFSDNRDEEGNRPNDAFIDALEGFLRSLENLQKFQWLITNLIPPRIFAALTQSPHFNSFAMYGDPHICTLAGRDPYLPPSPITTNPTPLCSVALKTLRALQTGDLAQVVQYGDVIRSPNTWKSLRVLEFDLSPQFISTLVDMEPLDPDVLTVLLRPPAPPPGKTITEKLALEKLALKDLQFQPRGSMAIDRAINPATLKDLYMYFCQFSHDLYRRWNNKMSSLERLYIKEEVGFPYLAAFLQQFGSSGKYKTLKKLELCCWHLRPWNPEDNPASYNHGVQGVLHYMLDSWSDTIDGNMDEFDDDSLDEFLGDHYHHHHHHNHFGIHNQPLWDDSEDDAVMGNGIGGGGGGNEEAGNVNNNSGRPSPISWDSIKDLAGDKKNGWGLEKLVLDLRPGGPFVASQKIPRQESFLCGFWALRELSIPVSYSREDNWEELLTSIACLPKLEYLCLLNSRNDGILPPQNLRNHIGPMGVMHLMPLALNRSSNGRMAPKTNLDSGYVDAFQIAFHNRFPPSSHISLTIASAGLGSSATVASSSKSSPKKVKQENWYGRLRYVGVRNIRQSGDREIQVWKIKVVKKKVTRRMSLRSSTKVDADVCSQMITNDGETVELTNVQPEDVEESDIFSTAVSVSVKPSSALY